MCSYCNNKRELSAGGFCKPCVRARSCVQCLAVNVDCTAQVCLQCNGRRSQLGAAQDVLALWCASCTSAEERSSKMCRNCYDDSQREACHHCGRPVHSQLKNHRCAESSCSVVFRLCETCSPLLRGQYGVQCKTCWYENGELCLLCNTRRAQNHVEFVRACQMCVRRLFCLACLSPPERASELPVCHR